MIARLLLVPTPQRSPAVAAAAAAVAGGLTKRMANAKATTLRSFSAVSLQYSSKRMTATPSTLSSSALLAAASASSRRTLVVPTRAWNMPIQTIDVRIMSLFAAKKKFSMFQEQLSLMLVVSFPPFFCPSLLALMQLHTTSLLLLLLLIFLFTGTYHGRQYHRRNYCGSTGCSW